MHLEARPTPKKTVEKSGCTWTPHNDGGILPHAKQPYTYQDLLSRVLEKLDGVKRNNNGGYMALCPAHDDHNPSLSIREEGTNGDYKILLNCFAGCDKQHILEAIGLSWKDLFSPKKNGASKKKRKIVKTYDYVDLDGELLHQTVRYEPKKFLQRRPDGNGDWIWDLDGIEPVLYHLPELQKAIQKDAAVVLVEGEKDADRAVAGLGIPATTNAMGAGKWRQSYTEQLRGARVFIIPDNDDAGQEHAQKVARELAGVAQSVRVVELPDLPLSGDLSDWLDDGGTPEQLKELAKQAPTGEQFLANTDSCQTSYTLSEFERNESYPALESEKFSCQASSEESGFERKKLLPFKSPAELLAEAGEGPDWIIKPLIAPGNVTDLHGPAKKAGKTTLVTHMIRSVRMREEFLRFPTREARVVYLTEQGNNFAEALRKANLGEDDGIAIVQYRDVARVKWTTLIERAVATCKEFGAEILVVYTFAAFSGLSGTMENNSGDVLDRMRPLKEAAQLHGLAVVYVRHAGKSGQARGSSAFEAEGDIILSLKRPEGNHAPTVRVIDGLGRYDETNQSFTIELTEDGYELLGTGEEADGKAEFKKAVRLIKDTAPYKPGEAVPTATFIECGKEESVSESKMRRALKWAEAQGIIKDEGKGVKGNPHRYWQPYDKEPPDEDDSDSFHDQKTFDRKKFPIDKPETKDPCQTPLSKEEPERNLSEDVEEERGGATTDWRVRDALQNDTAACFVLGLFREDGASLEELTEAVLKAIGEDLPQVEAWAPLVERTALALAEEEDRQVRQLISEGMAPHLAHAEVLGLGELGGL